MFGERLAGHHEREPVRAETVLQHDRRGAPRPAGSAAESKAGRHPRFEPRAHFPITPSTPGDATRNAGGRCSPGHRCSCRRPRYVLHSRRSRRPHSPRLQHGGESPPGSGQSESRLHSSSEPLPALPAVPLPAVPLPADPRPADPLPAEPRPAVPDPADPAEPLPPRPLIPDSGPPGRFRRLRSHPSPRHRRLRATSTGAVGPLGWRRRVHQAHLHALAAVGADALVCLAAVGCGLPVKGAPAAPPEPAEPPPRPPEPAETPPIPELDPSPPAPAANWRAATRMSARRRPAPRLARNPPEREREQSNAGHPCALPLPPEHPPTHRGPEPPPYPTVPGSYRRPPATSEPATLAPLWGTLQLAFLSGSSAFLSGGPACLPVATGLELAGVDPSSWHNARPRCLL